MKLHFFTVPVHDDGSAAQALNRFIAANRVIDIKRHLIPGGSRSAWAFCVTTAAPPQVPPKLPASGRPPTGGRIDYKQVLSPAHFEVFAQLRTLTNPFDITGVCCG